MASATITSPALRRLLTEVLRTDAEFDAFCHDYFASVYVQFSAGMERTAKITLLLRLYNDNEKIVNALMLAASNSEVIKKALETYRDQNSEKPKIAFRSISVSPIIGAVLLIGLGSMGGYYFWLANIRNITSSALQTGPIVNQVKYFNVVNETNLMFDQSFNVYCLPRHCHGLIYHNFSNTLLRPTYRIPVGEAHIVRGRIRIYAALGGKSIENLSAQYCLNIDINGTTVLERVALSNLEGGQPPRGPFENFKFETIELPPPALKRLRDGDNQLTFRLGCARDGDWIVFQSSELQVEVE